MGSGHPGRALGTRPIPFASLRLCGSRWVFLGIRLWIVRRARLAVGLGVATLLAGRAARAQQAAPPAAPVAVAPAGSAVVVHLVSPRPVDLEVSRGHGEWERVC